MYESGKISIDTLGNAHVHACMHIYSHAQDHPLGGYAGSSWGYKSAPSVAYDKVR